MDLSAPLNILKFILSGVISFKWVRKASESLANMVSTVLLIVALSSAPSTATPSTSRPVCTQQTAPLPPLPLPPGVRGTESRHRRAASPHPSAPSHHARGRNPPNPRGAGSPRRRVAPPCPCVHTTVDAKGRTSPKMTYPSRPPRPRLRRGARGLQQRNGDIMESSQSVYFQSPT